MNFICHSSLRYRRRRADFFVVARFFVARFFAPAPRFFAADRVFVADLFLIADRFFPPPTERFFVAARFVEREALRADLAFGRNADFFAAGFGAAAAVFDECSAIAAPCGSARIAIVPPPGTSIGGRWTNAPFFDAMSTALRASFTCMYGSQNGGIDAISGGRLNMPPNGCPLPYITYMLPPPMSISPVFSHPKSFR
jgi:hypothetical protein